jgi:hypothetical protein
MREWQLANLQMHAQMQANMQARMECLAEQQSRRDEQLLKERVRLDALYRFTMDNCTRQSARPQQPGPAATTTFRSVKDEPGVLLAVGGCAPLRQLRLATDVRRT